MAEPRKLVFCTPCMVRPTDPYLAALKDCLPAVEAAGWTHQAVYETSNPYISGARAKLLRKALDTKPDAVVFLDYDLSWEPQDMVKLLETEGDVVAATYRFKKPEEEYMGGPFSDITNRPIMRDDGCMKAHRVPAGFMKITPDGVDKFMQMYPELTYGPRWNPCTDLFNHGAIDGVWYGEDYAFSKRWVDKCGDIWLIPDVNVTHHTADVAFIGNYHKFMLRQPGGSEDPLRIAA